MIKFNTYTASSNSRSSLQLPRWRTFFCWHSQANNQTSIDIIFKRLPWAYLVRVYRTEQHRQVYASVEGDMQAPDIRFEVYHFTMGFNIWARVQARLTQSAWDIQSRLPDDDTITDLANDVRLSTPECAMQKTSPLAFGYAGRNLWQFSVALETLTILPMYTPAHRVASPVVNHLTLESVHVYRGTNTLWKGFDLDLEKIVARHTIEPSITMAHFYRWTL